MNPIGKRIENVRKNMDMSKAQFGKMIGITGQYLGTVEKGDNGLSVESIIKLCETTGYSADYFLFGIEDPIKKLSLATSLSGLSREQIEIAFDVIKRIAMFVKTEGCNEVLIQEVLNQQIPQS